MRKAIKIYKNGVWIYSWSYVCEMIRDVRSDTRNNFFTQTGARQHYLSEISSVTMSFGTASANSVESDLGCTSRIYFDNVMLSLHSVTLTSQKPFRYNNNVDCSETNGYNIPQDAINEVCVFSINILLKEA